MAKSERPGLDRAKVDAVVSRFLAPAGPLLLEEKSQFTKLEHPSGARLYIERRPLVRQLDLSGFGAGLPGTVPPKRPNGSVQAQLDTSLPEDVALGHLASILEGLGAPRSPREPSVVPQDGAAPADAPRPSRRHRLPGLDGIQSRRILRIKRRAMEMGFALPEQRVAPPDGGPPGSALPVDHDALALETGVEVDGG